MSKTSTAAKEKYNSKAYDKITIRQPKGWKAAVQAAAQAEQKSLAGYIREAVDEKMGSGQTTTTNAK